MAAPSGRVLSPAVFPRRSPVQNSLHPVTDAIGCFGRGLPKVLSVKSFLLLLQHLQDQRHVDVLRGQVPNDGIGVGFEAGIPLRGMFGIAPTGLMRLDIGFGALFEGHALGGSQLGLFLLALAGGQGIDAGADKPVALRCFFRGPLIRKQILTRPAPSFLACRASYSETPTPCFLYPRLEDKGYRHRHSRLCL